MKILHRLLILELIRNAGMFLAVILTMFFVMSLALLLGRSSVEGLPVTVVFKATWFQVIANLNLILPLTVLSAAIFTYGRANGDGEVTAMRVAGLHPWQILVPALFVGGVTACALAWLQDEIIPQAHFSGRVELRKDVFENLGDVLRGTRREIAQKRWNARWRGAEDDADGNLVLQDLLIVQKDKDGVMRSRLIAERAWPIYMERENRLHLKLEGVKRYEDDHPPELAGRLELLLDLDEISTKATTSKRESDLSYEELLTRAAQMRAVADAGSVEQETRRKARHHGLKSLAVFHWRVAFAFSAVFFATLGASLGLFRPVGNRALVFLAGFLVVMGIYYPLQQWGRQLGEAGALPAFPALWMGNVVLVALSVFLLRRAVRA